jgi:hypothetical protein
MTSDLARFLVAKRTVDDRALNRTVLAELCRLMPSGAPQILEVGGGLGTMVARLLEWQVIAAGDYTLLDVDHRLLRDSRLWLCQWATARGLPTEMLPDGLRIGDLRVRLVEAELESYLDAGNGEPADVLIANAFLDLVDVPVTLDGLLRLLVPGGVYWFTINFDGESIFEPEHPRDDDILAAYHRSMDDRVRNGRRAGERRTGRHLFHHLCAAGASPMSSGSSDWVVHARPDGTYPDGEAYFMECILQTIHDELQDRPGLDGLADWLEVRRRQLARGELLYIAHQLDVAGRSPGR